MDTTSMARELGLALDPAATPGTGKSSPVELGRSVMGGHWIDAAHLDYLNEQLLWAASTQHARLIVTMPPRHGKSTLTSRFFPAWYLGTYPNRRVILASYEADFAAQHGAYVRDVLNQHGPDIFGVAVKPDSKAKNRWDIIEHGGGMQTAGVEGPITGKGADLLIVDDPVKNDQEAGSITYRDRTWNWWLQTVLPRMEGPNQALVVLMTRWHEDDLVGRLLSHETEGGGPWRVVNLPAIAEEGDDLGRDPGAALWPERFDEAALARMERSVGVYAWASLYQQRPQPAGGGLFKRENFRRFTVEATAVKNQWGEEHEEQAYHLAGDTGDRVVRASDCWTFATVDVAASTKTSADYTVIACWAVTPDSELLLTDVYRQRVEGPDQVPLLERAYRDHSLGFIGVESVAYQLTLLQGARRAGLPIRALRADKDKWSRALTIAARYEGHSVYHLAEASWLGEWENELLAFPRGAHDDQVDTAAYAGVLLTEGSMQEATYGPSLYD